MTSRYMRNKKQKADKSYWKKHVTTCSDEVFMDIYRASTLVPHHFTDEELEFLQDELERRFE